MTDAAENGSPSGFELAVVGMSGRWPKARNVAEFWRNIRDGRECVTFFTDEELLAAGVDPAQLADPNYIKAKGVLEDYDLFDAPFFGFNPREAEITDPQHRLFLECAWEALEDAGCIPGKFEGQIGVYAGVTINTYLLRNLQTNDAVEALGFTSIIGNDKDYLTTRVSYKLDLNGPSLDIQTSCSTSLVSIHVACQALLGGECDAAIAGGTSVPVPVVSGLTYQEGGIYSRDGHCRAFDERAAGTVGGMGVGAVVLKRLEDALADGDSIYGVIKGSAINNDGSRKIGYTAPGVEGQSRVISRALAMADVAPETIGYIETHGTGTPLGDPIEIEALTQAWQGAGVTRTGICALGSVKTNLGHPDAAAGVTSLIKAVQALGHGQKPPSLHYERPNPKIDFASSPFFVNTKLTDWPRTNVPRRAGVSSFGMGGTNAHVIVEEAPLPAPTSESRPWQLLLLSAKTRTALDRATANLAEHLGAAPDASLADVAYTLQVGRKDFAHRRFVVVESAGDACEVLGAESSRRVVSGLQDPLDRPVVFTFPGQGAQYVGMGRGLYESEPTFRDTVDRCAELLRPRLELDLREVLYPPAGDEAEATERLKRTELTQPALFVIEYALARLWMEWGLRPQAMIGHSIGEYTAACLAGVIGLEDALVLVAARGRLMQSMPAGSMLAVPLPAEEVERLLAEAATGGTSELSLAAINQRNSCVVSGPHEAVDAFEARLAERDVLGRRLHTSHAFHSSMMEPILAEFEALVRATKLSPPELPFVSNLTGTWITDEQATDPGYWAQHLRRAVRFADGIETLLERPDGAFLEVGPGNTLTTLATRVKRSLEQQHGKLADEPAFVTSMRHPNEDQSDLACLLQAAGKLWLADVVVDWSAFWARESRRRLHLPTYPFERQRYWIEPGKGGGARQGRITKAGPDDWFWMHSWKRSSNPLAARPGAEAERWLVFADSAGLGERVAERLLARGHAVCVAAPGERFAVTGEHGRRLDATLAPASRADHDALLAELSRREAAPQAVLHLWGVGAEEGERAKDLGLYGLLCLGQAAAREDGGGDEPLQLTAVSSRVQAVTGAEELVPEKALAIGVCQNIRQECKGIACRAVDVDAEPAAWTPQLVDRLIAETEAPARDFLIAYRGPHRWVKAFEPARVPALPATDGRPARLRSGAVVVVTGGLGAIGLEAADGLARTAEAKLVLLGRSEFPPRDRWDAWLDGHDEDDETAKRIRKIRSMEAAGAEVLVLRADATDRAEMEAVLRQAEERFGAVHGVVHAAGAEKTMALFDETTREGCERQLHPKTEGLRVLEDLLEGRELDFCLVMSSLSSILGALGLVPYVAAHQYVDAFVLRHNRTREQAWDSVNLDNWLSWKEPEIALSAGEAGLYLAPAEGAGALLRVLNLEPGVQLAISSGDLERRVEQWVGSGEESEAAAGAAEERAALHERPELRSDYVEPRNEAERVLAEVWGQVLGIGQVGALDSFFELGGDSVLALDVVARAGRRGLKLTPGQVFEHPTVGELAAVAKTKTRWTAEQGLVTGDVPLIPIQRWFFEQEVPDRHHFNLPMMLTIPRELDPDVVRRALSEVVRHHDALRLRYLVRGDAVRQFHVDDASVDLLDVDLSGQSGEGRQAAMLARATELHRSLDLEQGPLVRAARFDFGPGEPARLLWIVHHLLIDVVSWRMVLEDFQTAVDRLAAGEEVELPPKTTSFKQWAETLVRHATDARTLKELAHWRALGAGGTPPLPVDSTDGPDDFASTRTIEVGLDADRTRALLQDVPKAYETKIDDVLLTALVRACAGWTGSSALLLDMEGHGRVELEEELDLSRTVGWCTTLYPVRLDLTGVEGPGASLKAIKEQLRAIPRQGLGYGMLRYLNEDPEVAVVMRAIPSPEVNFLYLGQLDAARSASGPFELLQEAAGPPCSAELPRGHRLAVLAMVDDGRLSVRFEHGANRHHAATIQALADGYVAELTALIEHCLSPDAGGHTPSDFPGARVSQATLDKLMTKLKKRS